MSTAVSYIDEKQTNQEKALKYLTATTLVAGSLTGLFQANTPPTFVPQPSELIDPGSVKGSFQSVSFKIRDYGSYEKNWDGYGGVPANNKSIQEAIGLVKQIESLDLAPPYPGLSGDGEINLFWDINRIFLDIGITGDGTYSFYAKDGHGNEYTGNYISLKNGLSKEIIKLIKSINS